MSTFTLTARLREDTGSALVEFALVLPLLLVIAFGILDFGKAFNYWNDTNHLAATGARFAAVNRNPGAADSLTLQEYIAAQGDTAELRDALSVCIRTPDGEEVGGRVEVVAQSVYPLMTFLGLGPSLTLRGTAVMRLEQVPSLPDGFAPDVAC